MSPEAHPLHVAIIPDGNGRWAETRGLPRVAGHRAGADVVRRVVEAAPGLGIGTLTLFAFSSDNWHRPVPEVQAILTVLEEFLREEAAARVGRDIQIAIAGRRDRLPASLREAVEVAEAATQQCRGLRLRLAVDYSSRDAIVRAACRMYLAREVSRDAFARQLTNGHSVTPAVDLLIRTGGEQRLSDFLLWECAYAELVFTRRMWPDFGAEDLAAAVAEFRARQRRFGRVPQPVLAG